MEHSTDTHEASDVRRPGFPIYARGFKQESEGQKQETTTHFVNLPVGPGCYGWSIKKDMLMASLIWWSEQVCGLRTEWHTAEQTNSTAVYALQKKCV
jgi:hypothetical protein